MNKFALNHGGGASRSLKAFTLAEVLITLAIIGVVAALTIPSVITNYRNQEIETALKSSFTILSNATNMGVRDYGPFDTWTITKASGENYADAFIRQYIAPHVKIVKKCTYSASDDCGANDISYLNGDPFDPGANSESYFSRIYLPNGASVGVRFSPDLNNKFKIVFLYVDTNGDKKPNKVGIDNHIFVYIGTMETSNPKLRFALSFLQHTNSRAGITASVGPCAKKPGATQTGLYCTQVLFANGWKIPTKDEYVKTSSLEEYRAYYPW